MPLALDDLTANVANIRVLALVHGLVYVHRGLNMVSWWVESCHLDILNLSLIDPRTFSREELLLMVTQDSVLNLVAFGRRALTLGKLLVHTVGLVDHAATLDLDVLVAQGGLCLACVAFADLVVLNMNHSRRAGRHMLRLQHLLLEVLTMSQLALLNRKTKARVVVVTHRHLIVVMTRWTMVAT